MEGHLGGENLGGALAQPASSDPGLALRELSREIAQGRRKSNEGDVQGTGGCFQDRLAALARS